MGLSAPRERSRNGGDGKGKSTTRATSRLVVSMVVSRSIQPGRDLEMKKQEVTQKEARGRVYRLFLGSLRGTLASFPGSSKGGLK